MTVEHAFSASASVREKTPVDQRQTSDIDQADTDRSEEQETGRGGAADDAAYVEDRQTRAAFRRIRRDIVTESNNIIAQVNERSSLINSAKSINTKQLESAHRLNDLMRSLAPAADVEAERRRLHKLTQISEEVEEEIIAHNIECRGERRLSGDKLPATFKISPLNYRATQALMDSPIELRQTIAGLKDARDELRVQEEDLKELRGSVKDVTRQALAQLKNYADGAIRNVHEAEHAARAIANQVGSGSIDLLAAHGGLIAANGPLEDWLDPESRASAK